MTMVFIMAQGMQSRMAHLAIRKQLLKVGGETLLARQVRQVRERGHEVCVVGWPDLIDEVCVRCRARFASYADPGICILDGIDNTQPSWSPGRNVFLLGDVVYSNAAMDKVFSCGAEAMFFGEADVGAATGELFAYSMGGVGIRYTSDLLKAVPCRKVQSKSGQGGHLRNLLWIWMKLLNLRASPPCEYHPDLLTVIDDWTDDLDTDKQVAELLPELDEHVRAEQQAGH